MAGFNIIDKANGTPNRGDYILKADSNGVYTKVTIEQLLNAALFASPDFANAGFHNSLYRGKNLGGTYTAEQQSSVSNGTFNEMFIGDFWTIGNIQWRIAGFDYFLRSGDSDLNTHHILVFPDSNLLLANGTDTHYMNDSATTSNGYKGTKLRETYLPSCLSTIESAFGAGHILEHKELLSSTVDASGNASNSQWVTTKVEIPTEAMIYGNNINGHATLGMHNSGAACMQMPLATMAPHIVKNRTAYWLRDVSTATAFCAVDANGTASVAGAHHTGFGVRPFFLLS